ncbi:phage tail tip fiber protein, partial [Acinetobacter variabilis]|uniref:phage tail tip fiber protein n=1 Tax=Acinetobacter variabilis TaxID=70346 RepID=UPI00054E50B7
ISAQILEERNARAEADKAQAEAIDLLSVQLNEDVAAQILEEREARVSADEAQAKSIDLLAAQFEEDIEAAIVTEQQARSDADGALTERIDTFYAEYEGATATFQQDILALVEADKSLVKSVETLQSDLDGNTALIEETKEVVDGLTAEWKIKVQAGGKVSGVSLGTDGEESQFLILADRFAVGTTGDVTSYPFIIDNEKVVMNTVLIKDGSITNAKIGNLAADKITSGSIAADRMKANVIEAVKADLQSLSALTAKIGHLRTATSGARTEIKDNLIEVYDSDDKLRVRLGVW